MTSLTNLSLLRAVTSSTNPTMSFPSLKPPSGRPSPLGEQRGGRACMPTRPSADWPFAHSPPLSHAPPPSLFSTSWPLSGPGMSYSVPLEDFAPAVPSPGNALSPPPLCLQTPNAPGKASWTPPHAKPSSSHTLSQRPVMPCTASFNECPSTPPGSDLHEDNCVCFAHHRIAGAWKAPGA